MAMAYADSPLNQTPSNTNIAEQNFIILHSSQAENMNCTGEVRYKKYAVWTSFSLILIFCVAGILVHLGLLLAFKLKQSTHKLYYGLYITLSVVDFAFCILWLVIEGTVIIAGLCHIRLPYQLCYLHGALFSMGSSAIVVSLTFITIHRICVLQKRSNSIIYGTVIAGIIATVVLPLLFTFAFTMDYGITIPYHTCVYNCLANSHLQTTQSLGIYMTVGVVTLFVLVSVACALLVGQLWSLGCELRQEKMGLRRRRHSLQKLTLDSGEFMESNQDSLMSHSSHRGVADCNSSSKPKVVFVQEPNHNDEEDDLDDSFDMQMRQKLARNTSGRRHTVANIGDNPLRQMRRGSYNELNGGKGNNSYNYIRKWSVDITALQDQLENPKLHGGEFTFPSFLKAKEDEQPEADTSANDLTAEVKESKPTKPKKKVNMQDSHDAIQIIPSIPAIVVDGNNTNHDDCNENEDELEHEKQRYRIKSLRKQLRCATDCLFLTLLTVVGFLPYYIILLLSHSPNVYMSVNIGRIVASACVFPIILHPLFLSCMEKKIYQAFKKLFYNLQHCKCVCYCNLASTQWKPAMTQTDNGV